MYHDAQSHYAVMLYIILHMIISCCMQESWEVQCKYSDLKPLRNASSCARIESTRMTRGSNFTYSSTLSTVNRISAPPSLHNPGISLLRIGNTFTHTTT